MEAYRTCRPIYSEEAIRRLGKVIGKVRPQIFLAIICATAFSSLALYIGMRMEAVEIVTGIVGGLFGFLGGVSLKVLENE